MANNWRCFYLQSSLQTYIQSLLFHPGPQPINVPGRDLHVGVTSIFAGHLIRRVIVQYWGLWLLSLLCLLCRSYKAMNKSGRSDMYYLVKRTLEMFSDVMNEVKNALVPAVVPEPVSFSPSATASSAFLPLFMLELARTTNTLRRHTTRTQDSTRAAGKNRKRILALADTNTCKYFKIR